MTLSVIVRQEPLPDLDRQIAMNFKPATAEERAAEVKCFFVDSTPESRNEFIDRRRTVVSDFLHHPQSYNLTDAQWRQLFGFLPSWLQRYGHLRRSRVVVDLLAWRFSSNVAHASASATASLVDDWISCYLEKTDAALSAWPSAGQSALLRFNARLFGITRSVPSVILKTAGPASALLEKLSTSALGVHLAARHPEYFSKLDEPVLSLMKIHIGDHLSRLPGNVRLPEFLSEALAQHLQHELALPIVSEKTWASLIRSYWLPHSFMPAERLLGLLCEAPDAQAGVGWRALLSEWTIKLARQNGRIDESGWRLMRRVSERNFNIKDAIAQNIFKTVCASDTARFSDDELGVFAGFVRTQNLVSHLFDEAGLRHLSQDLQSWLSDLLTGVTRDFPSTYDLTASNTAAPAQPLAAAATPAGNALITHQVSQTIKDRYLKLLILQDPLCKQLPSLKSLDIQTRSETLLGVFRQKGSLQKSGEFGQDQQKAFIKLLHAWTACELAISPRAAGAILSAIDSSIVGGTRALHDSVETFCHQILVPALRNADNQARREVWAGLFRRISEN